MKKYIVALLALICLASCNVWNGQTPTPDGGKKAIWAQVHRAIYYGCSYSYLAIYGEALMAGNQDVANFLELNIGAVESTKVEIAADKIVIINSNSSYRTTLTIITEGKRLSEGATWKLYSHTEYESGTIVEPILLATYVGKKGSEYNFTCSREWKDDTYYHCSGKVEYEFAYDISVLESKIVATISSTGNLYQEKNSTIDFATVAQKPIVFTNKMLRSGAVDILYKDLERNSSKAFITEVVTPATDINDFYQPVVYTDK